MDDENQKKDDLAPGRRDFNSDFARRTVFEAHSLEGDQQTETVEATAQHQLEVTSFEPTPAAKPADTDTAVVNPNATSAASAPEYNSPDSVVTSPDADRGSTSGNQETTTETPSTPGPSTNPDPGLTDPDSDFAPVSPQTAATEDAFETRDSVQPAPPPATPDTSAPDENVAGQGAADDAGDTEVEKNTAANTTTTQEKTVDDAHLLPAHIKSHSGFKKVFIPLAAVLLGALLAFVTYTFVSRMIQDSRAKGVFSQALSNTYSTKSFTKQVVYNQANYTETSYDVQDIKKPKLSAKTFVTAGGVSGFASEGYSTLDNTYVKFMVSDPSETQKEYADKWIQLRKDGKIPADADVNALELYDVRFTPFGLTSLGNFSESQRSDIVNYIEQNNVFSFEPREVKYQRSNAENLYMYTVTSKPDKIAGLSKKIVSIVGYGMAPEIAKSNKEYTANIWVNAETKRIVQIRTQKAGQPVTYNFYNFDKADVGPEPEAQLGWSDYASAVNE